MGSLRLRLAFGGALAIATALIVAAVGLAFLYERHAARALSDDLDVHLRQLAGGIVIDAQGQLAVAREPADPRFADPLSGLYWQATDENGGLLRSRSLWDVTLAPSPGPAADGAIRRVQVDGPGGMPMLAAERVITISDGALDRRVHIVIAANTEEIARARDAFMLDLAPALLALAIVLGIAAYVQIGLGLKPLERVRRGVAAIRRGQDDRLSEEVPAEVRPLVEELNALLGAQEADLRRARNRAADLAHGLKTPLAALAGDVDRLRERGDAALADEIDALGNSMLRHVERELARARVRSRATRGRSPETKLAGILSSLFATIARTPIGQRVAFETDLSAGASVPLDPDDLTEVLGNLIDNAARHARSRVRVSGKSLSRNSHSARPAAGPIELAVEDDGPGVPEASHSIVLKRGGRLDEAGDGAGLGLAIAQDILAEYGWSLELDRSPLGGLMARVRSGTPLGPASADPN